MSLSFSKILILTLMALTCASTFASAAEFLPSNNLEGAARQQQQIIQQQEETRRIWENEFKQRQEAPPKVEEVKPFPELPVEEGARCAEVGQITLNGVSIFSEKEMAALISPYENKCLSLTEINNLLRVITNHYINNGYVTSRAFISPEQQENKNQSGNSGGVSSSINLHIIVIEGKIEKIILNDGAKDDYYQGVTAFPGLEGKILNLRDIEQGLDQINRLGSSNGTMDLTPGEGLGGTTVMVKNKPTRTWRISGGFDNLGQSSTGQMQYNLSLDKDNMVGLGDQLSVYWSQNASFLESTFTKHGKTDGRSDNLSVFYSIPYGYWTFLANINRSNYVNLVKGAYSNFDQTGKTTTSKFEASRVIHRDANSKTSLALSLNIRATDSWINDYRVDVSSYLLSSVNLDLSHNRRLLGGVFGGSLSYVAGRPMLGATEKNEHTHGGPESTFDKYAISLSFYRPVTLGAQNFYWNISGQGQYSQDTLYSAERLQIGSRSSVRGFLQDSISGDIGAYMRNEVGWNMPWLETFKNSKTVGGLQLYSAYDYGRICPDKNDPYERGTMQGVALGLRTKGDLALDISVSKALEYPSFIKPRSFEWYGSVRYTF